MGHGGRTVTLLSGVVHGELLLKDLKRELGVGARVDGDELVVQGNQVDRVGQWLEKRGATGVVLSH